MPRSCYVCGPKKPCGHAVPFPRPWLRPWSTSDRMDAGIDKFWQVAEQLGIVFGSEIDGEGADVGVALEAALNAALDRR